MRDGRSADRAPTWLRVLILAVVLWLAVRIVQNVTESLTGMVSRRDTTVVQHWRGG
jgi:hypothetical protein